MNGREVEFIPDRLIDEPVVFRGLTDSEVVAIITGGIVFWVPVCVLILMPFGKSLFGVGIGFGLAILTLMSLGKYLQNIKRRMPDGLHVVYLKKAAQRRFKFINYGYIEISRCWDIRREIAVIKVEREQED